MQQPIEFHETIDVSYSSVADYAGQEYHLFLALCLLSFDISDFPTGVNTIREKLHWKTVSIIENHVTFSEYWRDLQYLELNEQKGCKSLPGALKYVPSTHP